MTEICRTWKRAQPSPDAREPDLTRVPASQRDLFRNVILAQQMGDQIPSIDRMVFDSLGRLWVRLVDERLARVHPMMARFYPELLPTTRTWEVLLETGMVDVAVVMPADFDPVLIGDRDAIGFQTLESGEIVVAKISW